MLPQPGLGARWNDVAGVAANRIAGRRAIVARMLVTPGARIGECASPNSSLAAARVGLRGSVRAGPVRISQRPAGANHRLAEIAAARAAHRNRTAEPVFRVRLALHRIVADQSTQFGARA